MASLRARSRLIPWGAERDFLTGLSLMDSDLSPVPEGLAYDATVRALQSSQQVFGRYLLRRVLGRGGMGIVWLGHDERLDRDVALKFLPDEVYFDPGALDELKRETRRCLELTHPNIIRIYDFVKDDKAAAISMEYIDGKTLAELRIEKEKRVFEVDEIRNWIVKVCQALYYAHEEVGVVHRDLKPANLMLTSRGQIKIADFGIAQSMGETMSRMTLRRGTSGTLAYMSPQQLNGEVSRPTDDVYAIGATIYEMLTSKPPFCSGDIPYQVRLTTPRRMAERRLELEIVGEEIPLEWEQLVARCLSKDPAERPQNMMELSERLGFSAVAARSAPAVETRSTDLPDKKTVARAPQPRPLPTPLFPTRRLWQIGGVTVLLLALWPIWVFGIAPFFIKPGKLRLSTLPPGATIQIPGQPDHVTPFEFSRLSRGVHQMTLSAPGFDSLDRTVTIVSGKETDLGTISLQRSLGNLNLVTVPLHAHYVLAGAAATGNFQKEGSTPDFLSNLPSGSYQLTLTAENFPTYTGALEVPAHGTDVKTMDLTQLALAATVSANPAKVFRGEMDASQLDNQERNELADLYNKSFADYLNSGLLASASDQLVKLKALGRDLSSQQNELAEKRASTENGIAGELSNLIADKRYGAAERKLKSLNGVLERESVDRLNAEFQPALAQYRQPIDTAIKTSEALPPADGYAQLKALVRHNPSDLDLQLALADVQMRMPPDHDRLTAQLRAFTQFSSQNKDFATDPTLLEKQAAFARELQQLDTLAAAKDGPSTLRNEIAHLESRQDAYRNIRVGHPKGNPFTQTINFLGKAVTGHSVVNNEAYFATEQDKNDAINNLQTQIETDQASLLQSQGASDDALKCYNDFVAQVPWGQQQDPAPDGAAPDVIPAPSGNP
jgi:serine/threonine protein kinase